MTTTGYSLEMEVTNPLLPWTIFDSFYVWSALGLSAGAGFIYGFYRSVITSSERLVEGQSDIFTAPMLALIVLWMVYLGGLGILGMLGPILVFSSPFMSTNTFWVIAGLLVAVSVLNHWFRS